MVNQEMMQSVLGGLFLPKVSIEMPSKKLMVPVCCVVGSICDYRYDRAHESYAPSDFHGPRQECTYVPDTTTSVVLYRTFNPVSSQSDSRVPVR